ncbi:hypothetical protein ACFTUC_41180 [Streptomyces sp. NPDC056944]|uniref:hypothetical protein n=1 Tax=unclassified Streptomyces TaxID=2593676 RepID=UPI003626B824
MPKDQHLTKAKEFAAAAEQLLPQLDVAGQAQTYALLAIAHAVIETGYDLDNVRSAIESME